MQHGFLTFLDLHVLTWKTVIVTKFVVFIHDFNVSILSRGLFFCIKESVFLSTTHHLSVQLY